MMLGHDRALICFTSQNTPNSTTQLMKKENEASKRWQASKSTNNNEPMHELNWWKLIPP
jgi:hypothetical protein